MNKEDSVFDELTTARIDAKLNRDVLAHEDKVIKIIIIVFFMLVFLFRGWISYWMKFGVAIPSGFSLNTVDVMQEPVQTDYTPEQQEEKTFIYKSLINDHKIKMIPQAHYELQGSVSAYNSTFILTDGFFESAALYDLGATWGKLSDKKFYNRYFKCYSDRTTVTGARTLYTKYKVYPPPLPEKYIHSHFSHSHIVPATRNVMAAMLKLKLWDKVKIEGELVDMEYVNPDGYYQYYKTSLSRTDSNESSRGYGACETIYVTSVQIGHSVYK